MPKMTCYGAQAELVEAVKIVRKVARATGNRSVRGSCNMIARELDVLIDGVVKVDFDHDDQYALVWRTRNEQ